MTKAKRQLEGQRDELQSALEAAESALEQSEAKVSLAQMEVVNVRQEIERRLTEKDDEFNGTRVNHARALESMQVSHYFYYYFFIYL
jgi:hypothetical protein